MPDFIYLASQSPRRRQLLEQLGIRHELLLPNVEGDAAEDTEGIEVVLPGEAPMAYVERVTGLKLDVAVARCARRGLPDAPILCADTSNCQATSTACLPPWRCRWAPSASLRCLCRA